MIEEIFKPYKCERCDGECCCDGLEDIQNPTPPVPEEINHIYISQDAPKLLVIPNELLRKDMQNKVHCHAGNINDAKITPYGIKS